MLKNSVFVITHMHVKHNGLYDSVQRLSHVLYLFKFIYPCYNIWKHFNRNLCVIKKKNMFNGFNTP